MKNDVSKFEMTKTTHPLILFSTSYGREGTSGNNPLPGGVQGWVAGVHYGKGIGRYSRVAGFTLLEIIVVVFILSLLVAVVAPRIIGRTDDARITEAKLQIRNFETALKMFKLDNGFYPGAEQGLEALIKKPETGRIPANYKEGGYLEQKKIPPDPWGNPYIYVSPGLHGDFDIISYGADGKEGGEGKDADIANWSL